MDEKDLDRLLEGLKAFRIEEDCGRAAVASHYEAFVFPHYAVHQLLMGGQSIAI